MNQKDQVAAIIAKIIHINDVININIPYLYWFDSLSGLSFITIEALIIEKIICKQRNIINILNVVSVDIDFKSNKNDDVII